jgi:two-component system, chemotaxis family, protein-glutamate methylesterase/glutaminase
LGDIRVLIIDDSHLVHVLLERVFSQCGGIAVAGNAYDGQEGINLAKRLAPDVIVMDINMPGVGGLEAIESIMHEKPTPVIVFSSASDEIVDLSFKAMELGAVDLVEKPRSRDLSDLKSIIEEKLVKTIRVFNDFRVMRRFKKPALRPGEEKPPLPRKTAKTSPATGERFPVIVIASSTGGPQTVKKLICNPGFATINAATIVVQHMNEGFLNGFREWLSADSGLPVVIPAGGDRIESGHVYVAPGGHHLTVEKGGTFGLLDDPPVMGIRPAADILFKSAADALGERVVAVVLTGMGSDGTEGIRNVKGCGGYVIAQDKGSSIIFGMPKSAIETGLVDQVADIEQMADVLGRVCNERSG